MDNKVWLQHYAHGVPATINPDTFSSLGDFFEKYTNDFSSRPAFTNFGVSISYRELKKLANDFAAFLQQELGLEKGKRIALMMPNLLQYPVAMYGALKAGLIVVNLNPLYTTPELTQQLKNAAATTIVVLENFADRLAIALPHTDVEHVIVAKIGDLLGPLKGAVYNFVARYIQKKVPKYTIADKIYFTQALSIGRKYEFMPIDIKNTDVAFFQYTGGTTGHPKGAMLTHRNIIANVMQSVSWIRDTRNQHRCVMVGALPMYHIFSLTVCGICVLALGGSSVLITNPRDFQRFVKAIQRCGMTIMVGLNTLLNALLHEPEFKKVDLSRLSLTIAGGMATQKVVADRWQEVTGSVVIQGYGLTESSPVLTLCPTTMTHFTGSVGLPIPSTEIVIRDEKNEDLGFNQVGEICGRGPQVMLGYWHADAETHQTLDAEGWLHTGDIGYTDERGFVYIVDRKKDMVLVSGFNVYPNEVEEVIAAHPAVESVAVIGIPSEKTGEALKAFVVKRDPMLTEAALIAYCKQSLTNYKIPHYIEFRDELPMSPVGKVLRRELRRAESHQA